MPGDVLYNLGHMDYHRDDIKRNQISVLTLVLELKRIRHHRRVNMHLHHFVKILLELHMRWHSPEVNSKSAERSAAGDRTS